MLPQASVMAPLRIKTGLLVLCVMLFATLSHGGHLHRHLRYRQIDGPITSGKASADALSTEVADLQQSMSSFGSGLKDYFLNLSNRLSQVEKYLGIPGPDASSPASSSTSQVRTTVSGTLPAATPSGTIISTIVSAVSTGPTTPSLAGPSVTSTSAFPSASATSLIPNSSTLSSSSSPTNPTLSSTSSPALASGAQASATPPITPPQASGSSDAFDPQSTSNLAVYYGQTPDTKAEGLLPLCEDPRVNIVILAFVPTFFADGSQYPSVSFGPACHADPTRTSAPGLLDCGALGAQVAQCQTAHNTKVLVSLGGYAAQSAFTSDAQATQFAQTLWDLFGGGTGAQELRPLGPSVVLDGFDIDNEDHSTAHWPAFATALKVLYAADAGRRYYLSAAPQCPRPDESIPADVLHMTDFVWVQFYNNPACDLDAGQAFVASAAAWSKDLAGGPRFYVGMGAWSGAGKGFVEASSLAPVIKQAKAVAGSNFGGIMLWDGTVGEGNGYVKAAKDALVA